MADNGIVESHLSEQQVTGKRLGRHVRHDPRSRDFPAEQAPQIAVLSPTGRLVADMDPKTNFGATLL